MLNNLFKKKSSSKKKSIENKPTNNNMGSKQKKGNSPKKKISKERIYLTENNNYTNFAKTNSIVLFLAVFYLIYLTWSSNQDQVSKLNALKDYAQKNVYSTILMTPNGMPLNVKKIPISPDSESFKLGIKTIMKNLIIDDISITSGFQKKATTAKDVYDNVKGLQDFYTKYINRNKKEDANSGFKSFTEFLNFIFILHSNDNLPETIRILSSDVEDYIVTENRYTAKIVFKVYYESYIVEKDSTDKKLANVEISLKGLYDLEESSIENPYGSKITNFTVKYVKKRENNEEIFFGTTTDWDILLREGK